MLKLHAQNIETLCQNINAQNIDFVLKRNIGIMLKMPKCSYICSRQKRSHSVAIQSFTTWLSYCRAHNNSWSTDNFLSIVLYIQPL